MTLQIEDFIRPIQDMEAQDIDWPERLLKTFAQCPDELLDKLSTILTVASQTLSGVQKDRNAEDHSHPQH